MKVKRLHKSGFIPRFQINIGNHPDDPELLKAYVFSITDGQGQAIETTSMRKLTNIISKALRDKHAETKSRDVPEDGKIIGLDGRLATERVGKLIAVQ